MDLVFAQHHDIDPAGFLGQGQQVLPVDPRRGQRIFLETLYRRGERIAVQHFDRRFDLAGYCGEKPVLIKGPLLRDFFDHLARTVQETLHNRRFCALQGVLQTPRVVHCRPKADGELCVLKKAGLYQELIHCGQHPLAHRCTAFLRVVQDAIGAAASEAGLHIGAYGAQGAAQRV